MLGWEGTAGLGILSPIWIIDEMRCLETGKRSPICVVIKASAGNRFIGDVWAPVVLLYPQPRFVSVGYR